RQGLRGLGAERPRRHDRRALLAAAGAGRLRILPAAVERGERQARSRALQPALVAQAIREAGGSARGRDGGGRGHGGGDRGDRGAGASEGGGEWLKNSASTVPAWLTTMLLYCFLRGLRPPLGSASPT